MLIMPFFRISEDGHTHEVEELARAVSDYGRMRLNPQSRQGVIVDVDELAFCLRENPRSIKAALVWLEQQGRARRMQQKKLWELRF